jgi:arylsulfatase A-like enzyme
MIDHDKVVGALLDKLDELGIADDTIVVYSTDNGPHMNSWPDAGMTPFRSEKNTNWEGAFRIPEVIRWPGKIPAGMVSNEIIQHHDWLPTFLAAAGEPEIVEKLKAGHSIGDMTYKVHIDGFNLLPYLTGEVHKSPRNAFVYFSDDGDVLGLRFDNWKVVFMEQRLQGPCSFGLSHLSRSGFRSCSTCAPIPLSGPTLPRTPIGTGLWTAPSL